MFPHVRVSSISISIPRHYITPCRLSTTSPPPHICHDLDAGGGAARGGAPGAAQSTSTTTNILHLFPRLLKLLLSLQVGSR